MAIQLVEYYDAHFDHCTLEVFGPAVSDLPRYIRQHPNLVLKGWSKNIAWSKYDALIHPATSEPFGMVVAEARSQGVPVLTTNLVGSTELDYQGVIAIDPSEKITVWAACLANLIQNKLNRSPEVKWTWQQLALQHLNEIYPLATED